MKTLDQYFIDWEGNAFGFGYGSGEPFIIPAVKVFFDNCPSEGCYDYQLLEEKLTPIVAWFLINIFCKQNVLEYGTSPRGAWLTDCGKALKLFVDSKSAQELLEIVTEFDENYIHCYPNACNCDENNELCPNPFWDEKYGRV